MKDLLSVASSKKMKENTIDTADQISMLPDFILHHILSYLPKDTEARVRLSVLSKRWFALMASFPILYFDLYGAWFRSMSRKYDNEYIMEQFYKYVEYTVSRFCEQNISAHTLYIYANAFHLEHRELFGRCLDLVLGKGLQVMDIQFVYHLKRPMLRLPNTLLSASSLTSLTLIRCELPTSLMVGAVKFKSLRLLSLSFLPIEEGMIEFLTESCPILEKFYLNPCYGFKTFCVKRHHSLQKVKIYGGSRLERIDVDAPNLSYFLLESNKDKAPSMFFGSCKKLTTFCYRGFPLKKINDFLSSFPFLENVVLDFPSPVNNFKLSNHSLREIRLQSYCDLEEIDLNAPNLLLFEYFDRIDFHDFASLSRKHSSMSKGCMKCVAQNSLDILWCRKFRQFLEKNSIFKVLKLDIYSVEELELRSIIDVEDIIDVEELKLIQLPPYELEQVELDCRGENPVHVALKVKLVLWCCRPRSLTLILAHYTDTDNGDVVKYTYEKLLQQEDEGQTNIYFSKDEQHFSDLNSFLKALSLDQSSCKITFIKEEVV